MPAVSSSMVASMDFMREEQESGRFAFGWCHEDVRCDVVMMSTWRQKCMRHKENCMFILYINDESLCPESGKVGDILRRQMMHIPFYCCSKPVCKNQTSSASLESQSRRTCSYIFRPIILMPKSSIGSGGSNLSTRNSMNWKRNPSKPLHEQQPTIPPPWS